MIRMICIAGCAFIASACSVTKSLTMEDIRSKQTVAETNSIISTLAHDDLEGRAPGSIGMEKATVWVEEYLREAGVKPFFNNNYRDTLLARGNQTYNVVGLIGDKNKSKPHIVVSAHLDHIGKLDASDDSVYNGANDNASGVTAVLQIARVLAGMKTTDKNVIVALFTAEEMGLLGSAHLAERLKSANVNIQYVINFEMIGKPMATGNDIVYMTGYKKSDFASVINDLMEREWIKFLPEEETYGLFMRSDNYPFFQQFNMPAHSLSTFDFKNYDYYHHHDDEVDQLDIPHLNAIINQSTMAIIRLLESGRSFTLHE